ncbi:unnamed protein product [Vitrella brassicaformis CCMP3155]|uniref:EF-hand domain-containing protein n=1 Tax=Vitrella brassicaformis (strain CCMP3155) TaxID=1169540 RepID=A0A0G4GQC0_VITBC|nr:unnamed protein product [Vitrella brassicaformis CCMP3155]|eukprot:CEM32639.1 unnamed protein product [Vitrella brassicaformis CCMP3155]
MACLTSGNVEPQEAFEAVKVQLAAKQQVHKVRQLREIFDAISEGLRRRLEEEGVDKDAPLPPLTVMHFEMAFGKAGIHLAQQHLQRLHQACRGKPQVLLHELMRQFFTDRRKEAVERLFHFLDVDSKGKISPAAVLLSLDPTNHPLVFAQRRHPDQVRKEFEMAFSKLGQWKSDEPYEPGDGPKARPEIHDVEWDEFCFFWREISASYPFRDDQAFEDLITACWHIPVPMNEGQRRKGILDKAEKKLRIKLFQRSHHAHTEFEILLGAFKKADLLRTGVADYRVVEDAFRLLGVNLSDEEMYVFFDAHAHQEGEEVPRDPSALQNTQLVVGSPPNASMRCPLELSNRVLAYRRFCEGFTSPTAAHNKEVVKTSVQKQYLVGW